jgi:hypothetical protein
MGRIQVSRPVTCHRDNPIAAPDTGIVFVVVAVSRFHARGQPFEDKGPKYRGQESQVSGPRRSFARRAWYHPIGCPPGSRLDTIGG